MFLSGWVASTRRGPCSRAELTPRKCPASEIKPAARAAGSHQIECEGLPAGGPAARIRTMATADAAAAKAPVSATAAPAPVAAAIAAAATGAPTPMLHGFDRARRVGGIADRAAVDRRGRNTGGADKADAGGNQHR